MDIEERVEMLFREVLELSGPFNRDEMQYNNFPKWDSLAHMALVAAIESDFDCIMETDDILDMSSFAKAVEIVKKYNGDN